MQTVALCRLLGTRCQGLYRDEQFPLTDPNVPLIVNGWLGYREPDLNVPALFAGVHIARHHQAFAAWMKKSPFQIGARDPFTASLLRGVAPCEMVGCATLTFDRYRGPRSGRYSIDVPLVPGTIALSQSIGSISWNAQWKQAIEQLELLRSADLVYTSRLHVVLPCLAFGTPVVFPLSEIESVAQRERLTLLNELPFQFDQPVVADVSEMAQRFVTLLTKLAGTLQPAKISATPLPIPRSYRARR
jgi:hypothetical protein